MTNSQDLKALLSLSGTDKIYLDPTAIFSIKYLVEEPQEPTKDAERFQWKCAHCHSIEIVLVKSIYTFEPNTAEPRIDKMWKTRFK